MNKLLQGLTLVSPLVFWSNYPQNNSALDKTYIYSYNDIGNITEVKRYGYTTGTPSGTPTTTTFGYDSDKLTSFNGVAFYYYNLGELTSGRLAFLFKVGSVDI